MGVGASARWYVGLNGQYDCVTTKQHNFVMPAFGDSKDSEAVAWECFYAAAAVMEKSCKVNVTVFDYGPLNRAQKVSAWWLQLLVDTWAM